MAEEQTTLLPPTVEDFAFQQHSSPHSLREHPLSSPPAAPLDHLQTPDSSYYAATAHDYQPPFEETNDPFNDADVTQFAADEDGRRISGVSSISSFPASVVYHAIDSPSTPTRRLDTANAADVFPSSGRLHKAYGPAFRNPSSVVAMQMKDEFHDGPDRTLLHRRSGSKTSVRSHGSSYSAHTSPSKRLSRTSQSSPLKGSKLKKEFPLVLLHCTLLPPVSNLVFPDCDAELFAAILPELYRKRWTMLHDRLSNAEVKSRGILVPHPQEDYELLEERLLESLELEKPRIRNSHFFEHQETSADSGFESASQTEDEIEESMRCPDCGRKIAESDKGDRKWEIKVYAANGLMRAGAWAAAWREMEKVDIEVGLWMPDDVRREVNERLESLRDSEQRAQNHDSTGHHQVHDQAPYDTEDTMPHERLDSSYASFELRGRQQSNLHRTPSINHGGLFTPMQQLATFLGHTKQWMVLIVSMLILCYAMLHAKSHASPGNTSTHNTELSSIVVSTVTSTTVLTATVSMPENLSTSDLVSSTTSSASQSDVSSAPVATAIEPASTPVDVNLSSSQYESIEQVVTQDVVEESEDEILQSEQSRDGPQELIEHDEVFDTHFQH